MRYIFADCEINPVRRSLTRGGELVSVEPQVYDILLYLIEQRDRAVTKAQLMEAVWRGRAVSNTVLTARMHTLRKAIDPGEGPSHIRTLHRIGYRFESPVQVLEDGAGSAGDPASGGPGPRFDFRPSDRLAPSVPRDARSMEIAPGGAHSTESCPAPGTPADLLPDWQSQIRPAAGQGGRVQLPMVAIVVPIGLSQDPTQARFITALAEGITVKLSKFPDLAVLPRTSSINHRAADLPVSKICEKLGVRYLVEGNIRQIRNDLRVTVQLIDALDETALWAEHYDCTLDDALSRQDEMTLDIVTAIAPRVARKERDRAERGSTGNPDAWENYQRGLWHIHRFETRHLEDALPLLMSAVDRDPHFAAAHAALAHALIVHNARKGPEEHSPAMVTEAHNAARSAVRLGTNEATSWIAFARVLNFIGRADEGAYYARKAAELSPHLAEAHYVHGKSLCLAGRAEDAREACEKAIFLGGHDPYLWAAKAFGAIACVMANDLDAAIELSRQSQQLCPANNFQAYLGEIAALGLAGDTAGASDALRRALAGEPGLTDGYIRYNHPFLDWSAAADFFAGLQKAGLPE